MNLRPDRVQVRVQVRSPGCWWRWRHAVQCRKQSCCCCGWGWQCCRLKNESLHVALEIQTHFYISYHARLRLLITATAMNGYLAQAKNFGNSFSIVSATAWQTCVPCCLPCSAMSSVNVLALTAVRWRGLHSGGLCMQMRSIISL